MDSINIDTSAPDLLAAVPLPPSISARGPFTAPAYGPVVPPSFSVTGPASRPTESFSLQPSSLSPTGDSYLNFDAALRPSSIPQEMPTTLGAARPLATPQPAVRDLFSSPQFMAPVAASLLNGIFSFYISERMAKEQRRAQQDMLDAQFEIATQQEEARVQEREQRAKDVTSFLQYAAGKRGK